MRWNNVGWALVGSLGLVGALVSNASSATWRETKVATEFQIFVPPNNDQNGRYSAIVITAQSGTAADPCVVDLIDDAADGDDDDTQLGVSLVKGQSLVRYIKDGAVNDDYGSSGPWDGDYMTVQSTKPVSTHVVTNSFWQHDWVPSDNGTLRGNVFFLYSNYGSRDINAFAYEDDTRVSLYDITGSSPTTGSGVTSIAERSEQPLMSVDLGADEDLFVRHGLGGGLLDAGRTYMVVATRPITMLYGAVSTNGIRDGGGFVPSANGATIGRDFVFAIPHDAGRLHEQELRIVSAEDDVDILLEGWDESSESFTTIQSWNLDRLGHADLVGGGGKRLFRLSATGDVAVFEANWLETGAVGTSDIASFASGIFSADGAEEFLVYLGPPGRETNTALAGTFSHVYVFSEEEARNVTIVDADTKGTLFSRTVDVPAGGMVDVALNEAEYAALNDPASGIRPYVKVSAPRPVAVMMANWNDNWMAYATAVVVRNPEVTLSGPQELAVGSSYTFTGTLASLGDVTLTGGRLVLTVPAELTWTSASLAGTPPSSSSTLPNGATELVFDVSSLAPSDSLPITLEVDVDSGTSGDVVSIDALATANESGDTVGTTTSLTPRLTDPGVATITDLRTISDDGRVIVVWTASGSASTITVQVVERSLQANGSYAEIPSSEITFPGTGAPQNFIFIDTDVINGEDYYYRIFAEGNGGQQAYAGPVIGSPRDTTAPAIPTLEPASATIDTVTIDIMGDGEPDLRGYHVERRVVGQSGWSKITSTPVDAGAFVDTNVTLGQTYEYRAWALDQTGNASGRSASVEAGPAAPSSRTIAHVISFEDMIGPDENDWDYNDFIVLITTEETRVSGGITRIEMTYEPLARGAGYIHTFHQRMALVGSWSAELTLYDSAGNEYGSLTRSGSGTFDMEVFDDTRDALSPIIGSYSNTDVTQTSWEPGERARLVITLDEPASNMTITGDAPYDTYLKLPYIPGANTIHRARFAGASEVTSRHASLGGVSLDFVVEAEVAATVVGDLTRGWPFEGQPIWYAYPDFVPAMSLGTHADWHDAPITPESVFTTSRSMP